MPASIETSWLFTRGPESVRIVRAVAGGSIYLLVEGSSAVPGGRTFDDVLACVRYQVELERRLVAQGFALEDFSSRPCKFGL